MSQLRIQSRTPPSQSGGSLKLLDLEHLSKMFYYYVFILFNIFAWHFLHVSKQSSILMLFEKVTYDQMNSFVIFLKIHSKFNGPLKSSSQKEEDFLYPF